MPGPSPASCTVALYARVSTFDQNTENQLIELRRYVAARGWTVSHEYIDHGISGAKDRRPALDQLAADVKRHKVRTVVAWSLDRLGRNLRHLVLLMDEWQARGVTFVTLRESIDTSTPAGRMAAGLFSVIAEFERARIQERVYAGLARAKAQGKTLGRRRHQNAGRIALCAGKSHAQAAADLGVSVATIKRWRRREGSQTPATPTAPPPDFSEETVAAVGA